MKEIILSFFRNKKLNIIYISSMIILLLIVYIFSLIQNYYIYNINNVLGSLEENRGYIIEDSRKILIDNLKKIIDIEKVEPNYDDNTTIQSYYVVIKNYEDTEKFQKYLNENEAEAYLKETTKMYEIEVLKKNSTLFNILKNLSIVVSLIALYFVIKNLCLTEQKNIAILKVLGFNKAKIISVLFFRLLILLMISIITTILIEYIIHFGYLLFNEKILRNYLKNFSIISNFKLCLFSFISLIINIGYLNLKINKINTLKVLND